MEDCFTLFAMTTIQKPLSGANQCHSSFGYGCSCSSKAYEYLFEFKHYGAGLLETGVTLHPYGAKTIIGGLCV
jgi:hypothetical protein